MKVTKRNVFYNQEGLILKCVPSNQGYNVLARAQQLHLLDFEGELFFLRVRWII